MMLVIYGPTVTGKTDLALHLAQKFNGELISADSRQVYKGLDIGTGKVSFESKISKHDKYWLVDGIKIHGFDLANPGQNFTAADFIKFASTKIKQIVKRQKLPIVVGGTGFYIKALIDGIESLGIGRDQKLREKLQKLSVNKLFNQLTKLNKDRAKQMNESDRANPRRLIRAIEIALSKQKATNTYNLKSKTYNLICLSAPNDYLYRRANIWLEKRLKMGLIDEVKQLLDKRIDPIWLDDLGLEYRWISRLCLGKITKEETVSQLIGDIHKFIRRQKTWFKKFEDARIIDISKKSYQVKIDKIISDCTIR